MFVFLKPIGFFRFCWVFKKTDWVFSVLLGFKKNRLVFFGFFQNPKNPIMIMIMIMVMVLILKMKMISLLIRRGTIRKKEKEKGKP